MPLDLVIKGSLVTVVSVISRGGNGREVEKGWVLKGGGRDDGTGEI